MFQDPDLDYIKRNGPSYVKLGKAFLYKNCCIIIKQGKTLDICTHILVRYNLVKKH